MEIRYMKILAVLQMFGGTADIRQVAAETGLHPNGVSQSLKRFLRPRGYVSGPVNEIVWKLLKKGAQVLEKQPQKQ